MAVMQLFPAGVSDHAAVVELANEAYRGTRGWTSELRYIEGARLTVDLLGQELSAHPHAHLLVWRESPASEIVGTVWLEPMPGEAWYLGLLTVRPSLQDRGIGRALLEASEDYARSHGASRIRMTVVNVRDTLIAWYQRRGYQLTGETRAFPYADNRFGTPLRDDLHFVVLEKEI